MQLSRGEKWILENAVFRPAPLFLLGRSEEVASEMGTGHPGLTSAEIVEILQRFREAGLIRLTSGSTEAGKQAVALTSQEIHSALHAEEVMADLYDKMRDDGIEVKEGAFPEIEAQLSLEYELTEKGGALWEGFAEPDWNLYIHCEFESKQSPQVLAYQSAYLKFLKENPNYTAEALGRFLAENADLAKMKSRPKAQEVLVLRATNRDAIYTALKRPINHRSIVLLTETWEELTPWKATYWKTFENAHEFCASYKAKYQDSLDEDGWQIEWDYLLMGKRWYQSFM